MHPIIAQYKVLVNFLGSALGPHYEITLHDLSSANPCVAAIVNGHISGRTVGAPLTDLALQFVKDHVYEVCDYKVNYRGVSGKNSAIRSSTMFIKDPKGQLLGMLCMNFDASKCLDVFETLSELFQFSSPVPSDLPAPNLSFETQDRIETFANSIPDVVTSALSGVLVNSSIPKERLTQEEKLKIVDALHQKGVFLLKGAVSEVAVQLCSSEASIYRYLSKLSKHPKTQPPSPGAAALPK